MIKRMKIFYGIFLFACLLLISNRGDAQTLNKVFFDEEYGYSINYPSTWSARIYRSGIVLAEVNANNKQSGLQIRFQRSSKGLQSFVENYQRKFQNEMQAKVEEKSFVTIDGMKGYAISFSSNRGGTGYLLKNYLLQAPDGSGYYIFQAGTPYSQKNQVERIIDKIAKSFKNT